MSDAALTDERGWLSMYLDQFRATLGQDGVLERLMALKTMVVEAHGRGNAVIIAGNGGSAAIASHCAVDFTKAAGIRSINFNEADLITCLANDFGYERWVEKALEFYAKAGDLVVLISSSGKSRNMINAARHARSRRLPLATFTGFAATNPLRQLGDVNFWVNSRSYNVVEMTHHIWLLAVCDLIIGQTPTPPSDTKRRAAAAESAGTGAR